MKKSIKKRVLSLVLALALVLGLGLVNSSVKAEKEKTRMPDLNFDYLVPGSEGLVGTAEPGAKIFIGINAELDDDHPSHKVYADDNGAFVYRHDRPFVEGDEIHISAISGDKELSDESVYTVSDNGKPAPKLPEKPEDPEKPKNPDVDPNALVLKPKKILELPSEGVATPTKEFKFTGQLLKYNNKEDIGGVEPKKLTEARVSYSEADKDDNDTTKKGKQVIKVTENDMLEGLTFTKAGVYEYLVKEEEIKSESKDGKTITWTTDTTKYHIFLQVEKLDGKYIVTNIQIQKDDGSGKGTGEKEDYKPADGDGDDTSANKFVFTNYYGVTAGNADPKEGKPSDADKSGLTIAKTVSGSTDSTKAGSFEFKVTLTKPENSKNKDESVKGKILNTDTEHGTVEKTEVKIPYGKEITFELAHNQKLVVDKVVLGTTAVIKETKPGGMTPEATWGSGGSLDELEKGVTLSDQGNNYAHFTNTLISPTGVLIDNLPFVVLIVVAAAGITFYVKNKKKAEEFN